MKAKAVTFESPEYGSLYAVLTDNGPWYFGKSIANALRMRDSMYRRSLKGVRKSSIMRAKELVECEDPVMKQWIFVDEEGADRLIRDSEDKHRAMLFRDWMWSQTHPGETLPVFEKGETAIAAAREITPAEEAPCADNQILKFTNEMFGEIRVLEIDGGPWFVGKDVAVILGYANPNEAISDHVEEYEKLNSKSLPSIKINLGQRGGWLINESGIYSLILSSKLPTAKQFKKWVTSEVLPSIRKHGVYAVEEVMDKILADPDYAIRLFTEIKEERKKNRILTEENARLASANEAMSEKAVEWDSRPVLNALVRSYSCVVFGGDFQRGWNEFYRNVNYDLGINLRRRDPEKGETRLIDRMKSEEFRDAIRLAAAMCQRAGLDPGKIINDVNAGRFLGSSAVARS